MVEMPDEDLETFTMSQDLNNYGKFAMCNWVKQAIKQGKELSQAEYETYLSIRFDKAPDLDGIIKSLNDTIKSN